jgi:hypothetical protein
MARPSPAPAPVTTTVFNVLPFLKGFCWLEFGTFLEPGSDQPIASAKFPTGNSAAKFSIYATL